MSKYCPGDGITKPKKHGQRVANQLDRAWTQSRTPEQIAANEARKAKLKELANELVGH